MNTISRALRHLVTRRTSGKKAFPAEALAAIQQAIAEGEKMHRAEIRLIVETSMPVALVFDDTTPRQRAVDLFSDYRVWDTEENCGALIYINLADHQVEIVADRGLNRVVGLYEWEAVCDTMTQGFARGIYRQAVIDGLRQLNTLLQSRFPDDGSNANQLANEPLVL